MSSPVLSQPCARRGHPHDPTSSLDWRRCVANARSARRLSRRRRAETSVSTWRGAGEALMRRSTTRRSRWTTSRRGNRTSPPSLETRTPAAASASFSPTTSTRSAERSTTSAFVLTSHISYQSLSLTLVHVCKSLATPCPRIRHSLVEALDLPNREAVVSSLVCRPSALSLGRSAYRPPRQ
ncbi:hypothetical protein BJY59DRAFT_723995, partial [Rhodotorula toruloides]